MAVAAAASLVGTWHVACPIHSDPTGYIHFTLNADGSCDWGAWVVVPGLGFTLRWVGHDPWALTEDGFWVLTGNYGPVAFTTVAAAPPSITGKALPGQSPVDFPAGAPGVVVPATHALPGS